jgi:hypothetical protein
MNVSHNGPHDDNPKPYHYSRACALALRAVASSTNLVHPDKMITGPKAMSGILFALNYQHSLNSMSLHSCCNIFFGDDPDYLIGVIDSLNV